MVAVQKNSLAAAEVSNSNCSEGKKRPYKVTRRLHYDADAIVVYLKPTRNSFYILFPAKSIVSYR